MLITVCTRCRPCNLTPISAVSPHKPTCSRYMLILSYLLGLGKPSGLFFESGFLWISHPSSGCSMNSRTHRNIIWRSLPITVPRHHAEHSNIQTFNISVTRGVSLKFTIRNVLYFYWRFMWDVPRKLQLFCWRLWNISLLPANLFLRIPVIWSKLISNLQTTNTDAR